MSLKVAEIIFVVLTCALNFIDGFENSPIIVATEYGQVKGAQKSTLFGRNYFRFNSIPYMKAPVGKLRFRDAQPPESWNETLDSTVDRPSYLIISAFDGNVEGQEDAGILSISTPYLDRNLPVAVYIHGGGFQLAYGAIDMYGPDYLLQKDIVLVSINYRVGPFGFLSLQDSDLNIPGNAGLKDQIFALEWIQRNIENFGGDPNKVTIFGTSAGAASVHFLMMTDQAKGLFHKAIPMSGTSFIKTWPFANKKELTVRLAERLGWDGTGGEREILEVLENADAKRMVKVEASLLTKQEIYHEYTLFPFTPVIEPYVNERTLIPEDPVLMGRKAWSNDIDCMIGVATLESSIVAAFDDFPHFYDFVQDSDVLVTPELKNSSDQQKISEYGEKLMKFYFGEKLPTAESRRDFLLMMADILFVHGIYRTVLSRVNSNKLGKTYFYRFNAQTELNVFKTMLELTVDGAGHAEDLLYMFKPPLIGVPAIESKVFELIRKMVSIITSFIISGDPNNDPNNQDFNFQPVSIENPLMCLDISNDIFKMIELPEKKRMKIWDELLEDAKIPLY